MTPPRPIYRPPADDEPLDPVQRAIVRALVPLIVERVRAELLAEQRAAKNDAAPLQR